MSRNASLAGRRVLITGWQGASARCSQVEAIVAQLLLVRAARTSVSQTDSAAR